MNLMDMDLNGNAIFDSVHDVLTDIRDGKPVVIVDDEDRENEGDVVVAAEFVTPEIINFMATEARGLICAPMTGADLDRLQIPMMVDRPDGRLLASPFTVSVEAARGVSTGISASDRSATIQILATATSSPDDLVMPGHIFPLRAHAEGIRGRRGHTEASVDLMRLAGLRPAAAICEIMNVDGSMARRKQLREFVDRHDLRMISISDIAAEIGRQDPEKSEHSSESPQTSERSSRFTVNGLSGEQISSGDGAQQFTETAELPTRYGKFSVAAYVEPSGLEHLVIWCGQPTLQDQPLVRIHSECLTGDALGSVRCDCGDQLAKTLEMVSAAGTGMVLYLRQEGRGIGLANKIKAYALQDQGLDTVEANECLGFEPDERDYSVASTILNNMGVAAVRLITNNPDKIESLQSNGITVSERVPLDLRRYENSAYMKTKAEKLQHIL